MLDAVLRRQAAKGTSVLKRPAAAAAADTGTLVESSTDETAMTVLSPAAADTGTSVESSKDETVMAPAAKKPERPSYSMEWSRDQALCRSGLRCPSQSKRFPFDPDSDAAERKAQERVEEQGKKLGFPGPKH